MNCILIPGVFFFFLKVGKLSTKTSEAIISSHEAIISSQSRLRITRTEGIS